MSRPSSTLVPRIAAARGVLQLGVAGTVGVASLVEALHQAVLATAPLPWLPSGPLARGLTGVVYAGVRGVAAAVGKGGDLVLLQAERFAGKDTAPGAAVALPLGLRSALNGLIGDRLAAMDNPVALPMSIEAHRHARTGLHPRKAAGPRVLFIHGLCMNDRQWQAMANHEQDYGDRLAREHGHRPVYLRYNSGLAIAENGRRLAAILERRHRGRHAWDRPLHVVAHSLGGLVIRSAIAEGLAQGQRWPEHLRSIVFLGTPHEGAPLERLGKSVDAALALGRFSSPWGVIGRIRSVAIHQLGHAEIAPWAGRPSRVRLHAIAGVIGRSTEGRLLSAIGDGLVPVDSALATGRAPGALRFDSRTTVPGVGGCPPEFTPAEWR